MSVLQNGFSLSVPNERVQVATNSDFEEQLQEAIQKRQRIEEADEQEDHLLAGQLDWELKEQVTNKRQEMLEAASREDYLLAASLKEELILLENIAVSGSDEEDSVDEEDSDDDEYPSEEESVQDSQDEGSVQDEEEKQSDNIEHEYCDFCKVCQARKEGKKIPHRPHHEKCTTRLVAPYVSRPPMDPNNPDDCLRCKSKKAGKTIHIAHHPLCPAKSKLSKEELKRRERARHQQTDPNEPCAVCEAYSEGKPPPHRPHHKLCTTRGSKSWKKKKKKTKKKDKYWSKQQTDPKEACKVCQARSEGKKPPKAPHHVLCTNKRKRKPKQQTDPNEACIVCQARLEGGKPPNAPHHLFCTNKRKRKPKQQTDPNEACIVCQARLEGKDPPRAPHHLLCTNRKQKQKQKPNQQTDPNEDCVVCKAKLEGRTVPRRVPHHQLCIPARFRTPKRKRQASDIKDPGDCLCCQAIVAGTPYPCVAHKEACPNKVYKNYKRKNQSSDTEGTTNRTLKKKKSRRAPITNPGDCPACRAIVAGTQYPKVAHKKLCPNKVGEYKRRKQVDKVDAPDMAEVNNNHGTPTADANEDKKRSTKRDSEQDRETDPSNHPNCVACQAKMEGRHVPHLAHHESCTNTAGQIDMIAEVVERGDKQATACSDAPGNESNASEKRVAERGDKHPTPSSGASGNESNASEKEVVERGDKQATPSSDAPENESNESEKELVERGDKQATPSSDASQNESNASEEEISKNHTGSDGTPTLSGGLLTERDKGTSALDATPQPEAERPQPIPNVQAHPREQGKDHEQDDASFCRALEARVSESVNRRPDMHSVSEATPQAQAPKQSSLMIPIQPRPLLVPTPKPPAQYLPKMALTPNPQIPIFMNPFMNLWCNWTALGVQMQCCNKYQEYCKRKDRRGCPPHDTGCPNKRSKVSSHGTSRLASHKNPWGEGSKTAPEPELGAKFISDKHCNICYLKAQGKKPPKRPHDLRCFRKTKTKGIENETDRKREFEEEGIRKKARLTATDVDRGDKQATASNDEPDDIDKEDEKEDEMHERGDKQAPASSEEPDDMEKEDEMEDVMDGEPEMEEALGDKYNASEKEISEKQEGSDGTPTLDNDLRNHLLSRELLRNRLNSAPPQAPAPPVPAPPQAPPTAAVPPRQQQQQFHPLLPLPVFYQAWLNPHAPPPPGFPMGGWNPQYCCGKYSNYKQREDQRGRPPHDRNCHNHPNNVSKNNNIIIS